MNKTVKNRVGKAIYGMLGIGVLVFTFYRYEPKSDLGDFVFMEMLLMMGILSFPSSILFAPLAFAVSFTVVGVISLFGRQFIETSILYPPSMNAFVFVIWLVLFLSGYLQWFWFPNWYDKRRLKNEKPRFQF